MKWWHYFRVFDLWDGLPADGQRRMAIVLMAICGAAIIIILFLWGIGMAPSRETLVS